jgi:phenylalanyl-tRNA synthetase beta chain
MKFSYTLIKKLVPDVESKAQVIETLSLHAFETEPGEGDTFEVNLPPNRYADASSHWGIAREVAAALNLKTKVHDLLADQKLDPVAKPKKFNVEVKDNDLCPRYTAQYFENIKIDSSPKWLQEALRNCGLRPISNVVDIMNYVMLETGQPLHAFDADRLHGRKIVVRAAKKGESITSIDGVDYKLEPGMLVVADDKNPQAVAGIKGGKAAEVTPRTVNIVVESANFDPVSVYKTSRDLKLVTDASVRFAHGMSSESAALGLKRAAGLLKEITGAKPGEEFDSIAKPLSRRVLAIDERRFSKFIGLEMRSKDIAAYLRRLGFREVTKDRWEIPPLRIDIETHEDMAEEVTRIFGLDRLKPVAPHVALRSAESDETILFKEKTRKMLAGLGFDEVYNSSFVGKGNLWDDDNSRLFEVTNPVSEDKRYLRPNLTALLLNNIEENFRFFDKVKIFEVGKIFDRKSDPREKLSLAVAVAAKKGETFFELKGVVDSLLKGFGLTDFFMADFNDKTGFLKDALKIESEGEVLGVFGRHGQGLSFAEIDLDRLATLVEGELSFRPLPKFPSVVRDVSFLVDVNERIGDMIEAVQQSDLQLVSDVDLVDEYVDKKWKNLQSVTLRIVFQAEDRTLTSEEVDGKMKKISSLLRSGFKAQVR